MSKKIFFIILPFLLLSFAQITFAQGVGEEGFVGPGGCTTKEECRAYCDIDGNKEECLTFAVANGMMSEEDADKARKFLKQTGPGGCRGDECKDYCEDPANTEECISFAEKDGLIRPGEADRFRKMREISQRGGPGGCKGEACRTYCEDKSHRDECFAFARDNGLLNEEQIEGHNAGVKIKQIIEEAGGPGGCKSEEECHQYCSNPSHIDECAAFGAKHTGKSPEEMRRMIERFKDGGPHSEGPGGRPEGFNQRREEFERRLREESGLRERMMREGYGAPEMREGRGMGELQGPGGCTSPESCQEYCMKNPQACGYMPAPEAEMRRPGHVEPYPMPELQHQHRQQFEGNYQQPTEPQPEPQTTSYDHSRSLLSNVWSAFMAPFRK